MPTTKNRLARRNGRMSLFSEKGKHGLKRHGGYIDEEWLTQLRGTKAVKVYREMYDNDPTVGAGLYLVDASIRQVKWELDPSKDEDERSNFIWSCMHDMSFTWKDFVSEILTMLPYGWSWFETVYKRRQGFDPRKPGKSSQYNDGRIGWRKFASRAQEALQEWDIDDHGGIKGMIHNPPPDYPQIYLPIEKSLLFRTVVRSNNPEGRSILRNAYVPWFRKKRIEEIEAIGIERDLAGLGVMYAPAEIMHTDASADDKAIFNELKDIMQNLRRDEQEALILPNTTIDERGTKAYEIQLLTTGGERQFDTLAIRRAYALDIAMAMLADILFLGHEKVGSLALAINKFNLLSLALGAVLDRILATFNRHAIPKLLWLNGMPVENAPRLRHSPVETVEPKEWAGAIKELAEAGYDMTDKPTQEHVREKFGMPELSREPREPVVQPTGDDGQE